MFRSTERHLGMTPALAASMPRRPARLARSFALVAALLLLGAACGGDDDTGDATAGEQLPGAGELPGDTADAGGSDGSGESGAADAQPLALDAAALPTSAIDPGVVTFAERSPEAPPVEAVVDTCAALPAATVNEIADAAAQEFSLGETHDFTAEPLGASCRYASQTHRLTVVIGPSSEVTNDPEGLFTPPAAGDITVSPWSTDASVSIFSEDSFGLDTAYAAHADAGDYGVFVANGGGTGIDYSSEGELFAELAAAAAAGSATAPEPSAEALAGPATPATDTCSLWSGEDLTAGLGVPVGPPDGDPEFPNECRWNGQPEGGAQVLVRIGPEASEIVGFEPAAEDGRVYTAEGGRVTVLDGPVNVEISVFSDAETDTAAAALVLALNIAARLG